MNCRFLLLVVCFLIKTAVPSDVHTIPLVHRIHSATERREFKAAALQKPKATDGGRFFFNAYPRDYIALNIAIGTPPQQFTVAVECGQLYSWVLGTDFDLIQSGQPTYNSTASSTSQIGDWFQGASGELQLYGDMYTDIFRIAPSVTIESQQFGDVNQIFGAMDYEPFGNRELSGAVGLLWHEEAGGDQPLILSIFDALNVTERKLTVWLGPPKPPSQGVPDAALTIGGLDTTHCSSSVNSIPWDAYLGFLVSRFVSASFSYDIDKPWTLVDTGYPLIAFEFDVYRAVYQQINPDYDWDLGLLTTPCSSAASLPSWVFTIGSKDYSVPPSNYLVDIDIDGGQTCAVALELMGDHTFQNIVLGNPFVRAFCIVYDVDNGTIGFAEVLS
ncbi:Peptidase A1 domain-containing protein [Aphelenchoides fujianensis]|nr:Peptidase A1 domain-containing protein [Aphelenchoides fujianensis]